MLGFPSSSTAFISNNAFETIVTVLLSFTVGPPIDWIVLASNVFSSPFTVV